MVAHSEGANAYNFHSKEHSYFAYVDIASPPLKEVIYLKFPAIETKNTFYEKEI